MGKIIILGCAGSNGVPEIGCSCRTCQSSLHFNKRLRSSIFIKDEKLGKVLVDPGPDFRQQALRYGIENIDTMFITHDHYDHVGGIGDLKQIFNNTRQIIPSFMLKETANSLTKTYEYIFTQKNEIYPAYLKANLIEEYQTIAINDVTINTFPQNHGDMNSLGFRIGGFAYSTDLKSMSSQAVKILRGVKTWIIDCQRYYRSPSHLNYEYTLELIEMVNPKNAFLTNMNHNVEYEEISRILPKNIRPLYDGMVLDVELY